MLLVRLAFGVRDETAFSSVEFGLVGLLDSSSNDK
jgi:hypothetical protein